MNSPFFHCLFRAALVLGLALGQALSGQAAEIHQAAERGDLARVRQLTAADPKAVNERDREQKTPLHFAAAAGHLEVAAFLIEAKAEINARSSSGITPLYLAQGFGRTAVAELLNRHGGVMDIQRPSTTPAKRTPTVLPGKEPVSPPPKLPQPPPIPPIILAVRSNDLNTLTQILAEHPQAVQTVDTNQWTALHHAAEMGHLKIAEALLRAGAAVNAQGAEGVVPLHIAVQRNNLPMTDLLLGQKAEVNARSAIGAASLHLAAATGKMPDMVRRLLQAGADLHARDRYGQTALLLAAGLPEYDGVAELLLQAGADPNVQDQADGFCAMHHAVLRGHAGLVKALLSAKANPNLMTRENDTPLALALFEGRAEIATLLRSAGAVLPPEPQVTQLERALLEHYRGYYEKLAGASFADLKQVLHNRLPTLAEINRVFVRGAPQVWEKLERIQRDEAMAWGAANRNPEDREAFVQLMRGGARAGDYLRLEPRPPSDAAANAKARRMIAPDIPVYQVEIKRRGGQRFLEGDFYRVGDRWVMIPALSQIFPDLGGQ